MALKNNAICAICGKPYRVCHTCQSITSYSPWRTVTDSLPHYMIYLAIYEYNKSKDKNTAKKALDKCDLSDLENFDNDIKKVIMEIMSENNNEKNENKTQTGKINKLVVKNNIE